MRKIFPEISEEKRVLEKAVLLNITPEAFDEACLRNLSTHCSAIDEAKHVDSATEFAPLEIEGHNSQRGIRARVQGNQVLVTDVLDESPSLTPTDRQAQHLAVQFSHHADQANIIAMVMGR